MKKAILWSIIGILLAGVVVAGGWWMMRPQVIVLKDGTKLTLLGITYGKHNVPPRIKIGGRPIHGGSATLDSTNDIGAVWIEAQHKPNNWPNFQLIVSDPANTAAVTTWAQAQSQVRSGIEVMGFRLDAFPRRHGKIILRVISFGPRGQQLAKEQFVVRNPAHGSFPQWTPDPLPDTQSDGDLTVTLTNLDANAPAPYSRYNGIPKSDPLNKIVQISFDVTQNGNPATNWYPIQLEASDATGNDAQAWINQNYQDSVPSYMFQSTLWPDEPAWKLRVEFSRRSGFNNDELWTVSGIPVKQSTQQGANGFWNYSQQKKTPFAQTNVNGIQVKMFPVLQYAQQYGGWNPGGGGNNNVVGITFNTDPDIGSAGMRMTVVSVTDAQGHTLENRGSSWGGGTYQYQYAAPRTIQSINITVAIHKSRFVEFTVKPTK